MGRWTGDKNPRWNNGRNITSYGYVRVVAPPGHPRADGNNRIFEHILVAEEMLGAYLPDGAVVHHRDENRQNNEPDNLQICRDENENEHKQIHIRLRVLKACGHADWLKCPYCREYDAPENLYIYDKKPSIHYHRACSTEANRKYLARKAAAQG